MCVAPYHDVHCYALCYLCVMYVTPYHVVHCYALCDVSCVFHHTMLYIAMPCVMCHVLHHTMLYIAMPCVICVSCVLHHCIFQAMLIEDILVF